MGVRGHLHAAFDAAIVERDGGGELEGRSILDRRRGDGSGGAEGGIVLHAQDALADIDAAGEGPFALEGDALRAELDELHGAVRLVHMPRQGELAAGGGSDAAVDLRADA